MHYSHHQKCLGSELQKMAKIREEKHQENKQKASAIFSLSYTFLSCFEKELWKQSIYH